MYAITIPEAGGPEALVWAEVPDPVPGEGEVLVEVVSELKQRKMWPVPNFEIMVDGGVRRASDVLKAVALGATAVGIGR